MTSLFPAGALVALALALTGCVEQPPRTDVITVCDSSGCRQQDDDLVTYDPASAVPDPDPNGLLPVLIEDARADPRAAFDLGLRYMRGDGIRRNSYQALQWMRDAAERGSAPAQSALGRLYLTGLEEMGADYNEAQKWLSLAAANGDTEARELLAIAEARRAQEQALYQYYQPWRARYTRPFWYRHRYYYAYPYPRHLSGGVISGQLADVLGMSARRAAAQASATALTRAERGGVDATDSAARWESKAGDGVTGESSVIARDSTAGENCYTVREVAVVPGEGEVTQTRTYCKQESGWEAV